MCSGLNRVSFKVFSIRIKCCNKRFVMCIGALWFCQAFIRGLQTEVLNPKSSSLKPQLWKPLKPETLNLNSKAMEASRSWWFIVKPITCRLHKENAGVYLHTYMQQTYVRTYMHICIDTYLHTYIQRLPPTTPTCAALEKLFSIHM